VDAGTTVTPTVAHAGTVVNAIPDHAVLFLDVRATTLAEMERVDAALRALTASDNLPPSGVSVTLEGGINRPPLEAEGSVDLVALCRREARRLGLREPDGVAVGGGSDGNFTAALGIPTLDGLGPTGHGAHGVQEYVEIDSLHERPALVAGMIDVLTGARD
jgi:glutamate carboxypeptidase